MAHITISPISHANSTQYPETPSLFAKDLWEKISSTTQKILSENRFVFPMGLSESYRYYEVDGNNIIIDLNSNLGHVKYREIRFGQNLITKEFLAFKTIDFNTDKVNKNHQEVVALRNLGRFKGLIFDQPNKRVFMAMELINGVTLAQYDWEQHCGSLKGALKLAISYLDELEFVAKSKVTQSDQNPGNVMIDLKKEKVFLIDFAGNGTFDSTTLSFRSDPFYPCINIADLNTIMNLLPRDWKLKEEQSLIEIYQKFYNSLLALKTEKRHEKSSFYLKKTINDLKSKLSQFLQTLPSSS